MDLISRYREKFPYADDKTLTVLSLRHRLLFNNALFLRELEAVKKADSKYMEIENAKFMNRWAYCPRQDLCTLHHVGKPATLVSTSFEDFLKLRIDVDTRHSKRRIMAAVEKILDEFRTLPVEFDLPVKPISSAKGNLPSDLSDIEIALDVFEKKKKASWGEIAKEFNTTVDDMRNKHNTAERLISLGIPSLKAFPSG